MNPLIQRPWKLLVVFCLVLAQLLQGIPSVGAVESVRLDPFRATDAIVTGEAPAQSIVGLVANESYRETTADAEGKFSFELTRAVGSSVRLVTVGANDLVREQYYSASVGQLPPPVYIGKNEHHAYFYSQGYNISALVDGEVFTGTDVLRVPIRDQAIYRVYSSSSNLKSETVEFELSTPADTPFELFESPTERSWLYGRSLPGLSVELAFIEDGTDSSIGIARADVQADGIFQVAFPESKFLKFIGKSGRYIYTVNGIVQEEHSFTYEPTRPETLPHILPVHPANGMIGGWRPDGAAVSYRTDQSSLRQNCYGSRPDMFLCSINNFYKDTPSKVYLTIGSDEYEIPVDALTLNVNEPKALDRFVTGQTAPHAFVRINNGTLFVGDRADEAGNFSVTVPPIAHNGALSVEAKLGAPYFSMQTKEIQLTDERPLPEPAYQLTDQEMKVTLSRQKTTTPSASLLLERKNGSFQNFEMTLSENGSESFVYTLPGDVFADGDQFTINIEDGTDAHVSLSDTVVGKSVIFGPVTNEDRTINGKTGPGLIVYQMEGEQVTSAEDGTFSLPFRPMTGSETIEVRNQEGTQRYRHTVQVKDVTAPILESVERTNWETVILAMSEPSSSLTYRTLDALGGLLQEGTLPGSTWQRAYEIRDLQNYAEVRFVEVEATDREGNTATTKMGVSRVGAEVTHHGALYEGGRTLSFDGAQLGDVVVVERDGKRMEQTVEQRDDLFYFNLETPLEVDETLTYWMKGDADNAKSVTVSKRNVTWNLFDQSVQTISTYHPFNADEQRVELWVKDDMGQERLLEVDDVLYHSTLTYRLAHPYISTQQFIFRVKDREGRITYESVKRFEEEVFSVTWDDYISMLRADIGQGTTLQLSHEGEIVRTEQADAQGSIQMSVQSLPLIPGQVWTFTLIGSDGIKSSYDIPVQSEMREQVKEIEVPTLSTQELKGVVQRGYRVSVRSNKGITTIHPDFNGEFTVPASKLGAGVVQLNLLSTSKGMSRPIYLPRIVTLDRIATKGDLRTKGKVVPYLDGAEMTLVAGDETYQQKVTEDGLFNISHEPLPLNPVSLHVTNARGDSFKLNKPEMLNRFTDLAVATFTTSSTVLYALAPAGTFVQAVVNDRIVSTDIASDASRIELNMPRLPVGTSIELRYWKTGYRGAKQTIQTMGTLPLMSMRATTFRSDVIRGVGTFDATVTAYVGSKRIGEPTLIGDSGAFSISIPPQSVGTEITLVEEKPAHITRTQTIRVLDLIRVMSVSPIRTTQTVAYGMGQPGATVQAFVGSKAISRPERVTSFSTYRVDIPKLKAGTPVTIKMSHPDYLERTMTVRVK
ncbi:hypothetical protein PJK55_08305 [Exiguobacterium sp. MMG028]|uniref:hypothetical protein n=1 Tax=Exiguobacterium sp. MMG028 TaxID=3021979 RepID=UPI0022FEEB2E|nr:hypothetical protein [Exiguobacterium sp. MMG028]MDA5560728.1 hypothetical protein [Exiguobacterium sp. MMG028]